MKTQRVFQSNEKERVILSSYLLYANPFPDQTGISRRRVSISWPA